MERLYTDYPELYDAIQSEWDYDRDCAFVQDLLDDRDPADLTLLEIGCGTGEHTQRFVDAGYDVTAIDPNEGMLSRAREKVDADYHAAGVPGIPVDSEFDVVVAIRGVINHLPPAELGPAIEDVAAHLAADGVFVFDNSPLPPEGNEVAIDVGETDAGRYARLVQMNPDGDRLRWDQIVFTPDGEVCVDTRPMTPFDDLEIAATLSGYGLDVEPVGGYGPDDDRTVFVCTPR
ncbi:class I SAM-dependent DNA methyltransferase [Halapricum hydrolyticum]|uniref:Class I SAM-dependent methyltransferase n=1 Tax=Halapricum hydrolyticum TaxID=2979991 RepID=A0AAE3IA53_9EURY|nr:class I SAM-dependent methyltransferase [Halapricum hydrolyticum]MCU4716477.1 class I SAM-dependent methyltransferase [Halapricum hydrolyticum]MCU4725919.1 class I SAM-dependent methyltransferase [Halapricum hydrolyticum]